MKRKLALVSCCSLLCTSMYANDPMIVSLGLSKMNSQSTLNSTHTDTEGYTSVASVSKVFDKDWIGSIILAYGNYDAQISENNTHKDIDVKTVGFALSSIHNRNNAHFFNNIW